jgi:hypothetical protein
MFLHIHFDCSVATQDIKATQNIKDILNTAYRTPPCPRAGLSPPVKLTSIVETHLL